MGDLQRMVWLGLPLKACPLKARMEGSDEMFFFWVFGCLDDEGTWSKQTHDFFRQSGKQEGFNMDEMVLFLGRRWVESPVFVKVRTFRWGGETLWRSDMSAFHKKPMRTIVDGCCFLVRLVEIPYQSSTKLFSCFFMWEVEQVDHDTDIRTCKQ